MHLTLSLGIAASKSLPDWVRSRIDGNLTANAERWRRTKVAFKEIALAFAERQIEFLALKGFTHYPRFAADPRNRTQGDLDLLVTEDQVTRAFEAARSLDYVPIQESVPRPIDHLPMMVRQTGWRWRGDFYDVDNPVSLELHFRLWDSGTEMFDPPGLDAKSRASASRRFIRPTSWLTQCSICCGTCCAATCARRMYTSWPGTSITAPAMKRSGERGATCTIRSCVSWKLSASD